VIASPLGQGASEKDGPYEEVPCGLIGPGDGNFEYIAGEDLEDHHGQHGDEAEEGHMGQYLPKKSGYLLHPSSMGEAPPQERGFTEI